MACLLAFRGPCVGKHRALLFLLNARHFDHCDTRCLSHEILQQKCRHGRLLPIACHLPVVPATTTTVQQLRTVARVHRPLSSHEEKPAKTAAHPVADLVKGKDMEWRSTKLDVSKLPKWYTELAKVRLTGLVVVTAMAGYAMAPGAFSGVTLALVASGTLLTSSAANALNQWLEAPYDAQMARTAARPLVKGHVSPLHAVTFAAVCASSGISLLYMASPLAAALGGLNLALYTAVYTPMKRVTIANTWVGAVVGGIPPLMGWAAATDSLAPGAFLLAALLYAWQFPHFNALSWSLRKDYARAGYRIMAVTHPDLTGRVALRYSLLLTALPVVTSVCDVTTWTYAVDSLPINAYLVYLAVRFYREKESSTARALTRFSYLQLTAGIILMLLAKQHCQAEPQQQQTVVMETEQKQGGSSSVRDWCIGEPLIARGWNLSGLFTLAESDAPETISTESVAPETASGAPSDERSHSLSSTDTSGDSSGDNTDTSVDSTDTSVDSTHSTGCDDGNTTGASVKMR